MRQLFQELPSWTFEIEEISASVYEVTGTDTFGRRVQLKGIDPDVVLEDARTAARRIQTEVDGQ